MSNDAGRSSSLMILVAKCDACLRIGGPSKGADEMVALARSFQKQVFLRYEDVPPAV